MSRRMQQKLLDFTDGTNQPGDLSHPGDPLHRLRLAAGKPVSIQPRHRQFRGELSSNEKSGLFRDRRKLH